MYKRQTLLPATPETQGFGKDAKPVPLLESFQPSRRVIEGDGVDGLAETQGQVSEVLTQIREILQTKEVHATDAQGQPTEQALNIATEILQNNGYSEEAIANFSLDQFIKQAKEEQADATELVVSNSLLRGQSQEEDVAPEEGDVEGDERGPIQIDRNGDGDVYLKKGNAEIIIRSDDSIDDDWNLVNIYKKYSDQMDRDREIEIGTLYSATPEKYTESLGTRDRLGNFKYSLGDELDLGDNADFEALQQKIRNGLTEKGLFDLSKEDAAAELLNGILGKVLTFISYIQIIKL